MKTKYSNYRIKSFSDKKHYIVLKKLVDGSYKLLRVCPNKDMAQSVIDTEKLISDMGCKFKIAYFCDEGEDTESPEMTE